MTATAPPSRKEQAVQLRLAGLSRSQIADALGLAGGGEPLSRWLRDVPPPAWTRRPRAKDDLREIAVAMRQEGRSYREIREIVGVAKSTLSLWLRDIPLTEEQRLALALRCPPAASRRARAIRASAAQRRQRVEADARDQTPTSARASSSSPVSWPTGPKGLRTSHGEPAHGSRSSTRIPP